jgi:SAM-dependent methyltransferase
MSTDLDSSSEPARRPLDRWRTVGRRLIGWQLVRKVLLGPEEKQWARVVVNRETERMIARLDVRNLRVLEISGTFWQDRFPFQSYKSVSYPAYDVCDQSLAEKFDLIIAEQVWEHLLQPYRATQNVRAMLAPGGKFLVTTPFLVRFHPQPHDCTRWTETGLKHFLVEAGGFEIDKIETGSWGNRACAVANFRLWRRYLPVIHSLKNDEFLPVAVWALAGT